MKHLLRCAISHSSANLMLGGGTVQIETWAPDMPTLRPQDWIRQKPPVPPLREAHGTAMELLGGDKFEGSEIRGVFKAGSIPKERARVVVVVLPRQMGPILPSLRASRSAVRALSRGGRTGPTGAGRRGSGGSHSEDEARRRRPGGLRPRGTALARHAARRPHSHGGCGPRRRGQRPPDAQSLTSASPDRPLGKTLGTEGLQRDEVSVAGVSNGHTSAAAAAAAAPEATRALDSGSEG